MPSAACSRETAPPVEAITTNDSAASGPATDPALAVSAEAGEDHAERLRCLLLARTRLQGADALLEFVEATIVEEPTASGPAVEGA